MTPDEAKEAYRAAWQNYCLCPDPARKRELEMLMDSLQPKICRGPGPEWTAFTESLPGFLDFWDGLVRRVLDRLP